MGQITVDASRCRKDRACVAVCPSRTLTVNAEGYPEEISDRGCILCGHCVAVCTTSALTHSGLPREALLPMSGRRPAPALMDAFLMERRSVREFKDAPVGQDVLEALLDVARRAPTASNSQNLHWIVVTDRAKLHSLAQETVNGTPSIGLSHDRLEQWESGYDFVLRGAPTLVVACAPADYEWGKTDGAIALTYLELAAEARGLGVCWAGYLTRVAAIHAPLRRLLSLPEGYSVCGGLMLGEGKYSYRFIPPRKPLDVQWN